MAKTDEYENFYTKLVSVIRDQMKKKNVTQKEMAYAVGCSYGTFQNKITNCGGKFDILQFYKICKFLHIDMVKVLDYVTKGENEK